MNILNWLIFWFYHNRVNGLNEVTKTFRSDKDIVDFQFIKPIRTRPNLSKKKLAELKIEAEKMRIESKKGKNSLFSEVNEFDFYSYLLDSYKKSIDSDWKYDYSIIIDTIDNPGWSMYIYIRGTTLNDRIFEDIECNISERDWISCKVENNVFKGFSSPDNLKLILKYFKGYVEQTQLFEEDYLPEVLNWLIEWYKSNCDGDWEHSYGIKIETLDNPGWLVKIDLSETKLEDKEFKSIKVLNNKDDWLFGKVKDNIFHGIGDIYKLEKILELFKRWGEN